MRFPGSRNAKYYFPVTGKGTRVIPPREDAPVRWFGLGVDEILVDMEVHGSFELAKELGFIPGESVHISPDKFERLLERFSGGDADLTYTPGGTVGNTLCNYTHLSGEPAVLLGAMETTIRPGSPAFSYVAKTPPAVSLDFCEPVDGTTGVAVTFITPDGDRGFGVAPGVSGAYSPGAVPEALVRRASFAATSLYCLADPDRPIARAAQRMLEIARDADTPVAFGLGTARLVREQRERVRALLAEYVSIAAMNQHEAEALTGQEDVLLACQELLDIVDVVLITEGPRGLTLGGWTDDAVKRETRHDIRSKSIPEYNRWEFSRVVRRKDCDNPLKIYSHIHPYKGGPETMGNTNGAGDAALAALLHDIGANHYHRLVVPGSRKHSAERPFFTYSSLSRNAQYCNRVAYEVLRGRSPRLNGPVGEDEEHGTLDRE